MLRKIRYANSATTTTPRSLSYVDYASPCGYLQYFKKY